MVQPPNLQRRPAKPALGNGRIQRAVRRAFYFGSEVTSSDIYDWVYPRRRHLLTQAHRHSARRVLMTMADPVERVPPYGAERELILARTGDGRARAKARACVSAGRLACPRTNGGRPLRALRRAFRRPIWRDPTACRKRRSADWLHRALSGQSRPASRQAREAEAALGHVEPTFFRLFGLLVIISREAQQGPLSQLVPHLLRESADFRGALAPSVGLSRGPCHGAKA
jgi:hypothetical protein